MQENIFVLGAPRTGFTLLISIINELLALAPKSAKKSNERLIHEIGIDIASIYLKHEFFDFFQKRIDMKDYMYNGEFELLVGGPKWINPANKDECIIRKYIGIKDNGDFTFLLYLPKGVLNYNSVVHSHYFPKSWIEDSDYHHYYKFASMRNPLGVINSAVFSINAITSEYITKYSQGFDEDEFREIMALYKLTDLDLFEGLVKFLKAYLDEFIPVSEAFDIVKWEDIIDHPIETIHAVAQKIGFDVSDEEAQKLWSKLDHKNLPKHHLYNFRKGHGIVGEWKRRLTNHHLKIFEKYGFNTYLKQFGYEEIRYFDEAEYNDFQKEIDAHIKAGTICNKITDENLFKFCWNKSNIAQTSHQFDRFERLGHTQVERSSLKDKTLALDFAQIIAPKIEWINTMIKELIEGYNIGEIKEKYAQEIVRNLAPEQQKIVEQKFDALLKVEQREKFGKLELKLVQEEALQSVLEGMEHFYIASQDASAKALESKFAHKINTASPNIVITDDDPSEALQHYHDKREGVIVAKQGKKYWMRQPLFLISVPKAGTHLLFELVKAFGYKEGGICPSRPKGGRWYYTEYSNAHTSAKHFFNETVYSSSFGNRDHPFVTSPAIFIYRNPLDIVASEANYYHKEGKTAFSGYLQSLSYEQRAMKLISDPWLLGTIRDRISHYVAWNYFDNVISVSFEELIGKKGGGDDVLQQKLIWSLQLKLQVPGSPAEFAKKIFNEQSATFFKGNIYSHKTLLKAEHMRAFQKLNQDFMRELGYRAGSANRFSSKVDYFRKKKLHYQEAIDFPPILKEKGYYGYNIVKYAGTFYALPQTLGSVDLASEALDSTVLQAADIDALKNQILEEKIKAGVAR